LCTDCPVWTDWRVFEYGLQRHFPLSIQEIAVLAHQIYRAIAPASHVLRWAFIVTACALAAIAVVLLVSRHPSVGEKPDSEKGAPSSISSLKVDAYRQHKPLGSAFSTPQHRPEAVVVTAQDSLQVRPVP
jgi:hypothetical protein